MSHRSLVFFSGGHIIGIVLTISLVLLTGISIYVVMSGKLRKKYSEVYSGKLSALSFVFTLSITLVLMAFLVLYNTGLLYNSSVTGVYEDGESNAKSFSNELENYLTNAESTLRVAAYTVELMKKIGIPIEDIHKYLVDMTKKQTDLFDDNFMGMYSYIDGHYIDGTEWIPPEDYVPEARDWYKAAVDAAGDIVIVSPYVDAETGSIVITVAKEILSEDNKNVHSVICLDVIMNHLQEITELVDIDDKGYGIIVNHDGFIVSHHDKNYNGKNIQDIYGKEFLENIHNSDTGVFKYSMQGRKSDVFISPILRQWYAVVVVDNSELFKGVRSLIVINIIISLIIFAFILFFYYLNYKNERRYDKKIEEVNVQTVSALAAAIDAKDTYTNGHSSRVAEYSRMIASRLGYSEARKNEIYMMALLHDVGKIGVPDTVINKAGKLTDEEFELIKAHPAIGSRILQSIDKNQRLYVGARWHHEKYAGNGYPDGIAGNEIPEEARIIAVADAYDAMTSNRSYRDIMPQSKVREQIEKGIGTQFDPVFATVMLQLIDEDKDYKMCGK